jgi:hypothetical protein
MASSTGSAISARDFSDKVTDPNRDEWSSGAMHHLVKALNGSPVAIVLDKSTGFAEVNVTLGGVRQNPGYGTFQVLVKRVHSDGTTGGCWYPLFQVGTVIELGDSRARWIARESYRTEKSAAIRRLHDEMADDLATEHLDDFPAGEWEASMFPGFVHASFRPESYCGPVNYTWKRYESKDLATA